MRRAIGILMLVAISVMFVAGLLYLVTHEDRAKDFTWWPLERRDKSDIPFGFYILLALLSIVKIAVVIALVMGYVALVVWLTEVRHNALHE